MSKHQIFLVHGMGNFEPGWSAGIQKQIVDAFGQYKRLADGHFVDSFEFKEVTYNNVFEEWRQQWKKDAGAAAGVLTSLGLDDGIAMKLIELAQAPAGASFWQTHVLDVVMYRYLMPIAEAVRRVVQMKIIGHLDSFPPASRPAYSVIAHSLGTAVAYETFHGMVTDPGGLPIGYRPSNFFAIANVIKILWNRGGACYPREMGPNLADDIGLCYHFADYRHELDPFCHVNPFHPPDPSWFDPDVPTAEVYYEGVILKSDIQDFNVHAMEHYLSHPDVHVPMLRQLVKWKGVISDQELIKARKAWQAKTLQKKAKQEATSELSGMLVNATPGFSSEISAFLAFREAVLKMGKRDGES